jgi:hypothetical protein
MDSELRAQVLTLLALLAQKYTNIVAPAVVPALLHNVRDTECCVQMLTLLTLLLASLAQKYRYIHIHIYVHLCLLLSNAVTPRVAWRCSLYLLY